MATTDNPNLIEWVQDALCSQGTRLSTRKMEAFAEQISTSLAAVSSQLPDAPIRADSTDRPYNDTSIPHIPETEMPNI